MCPADLSLSPPPSRDTRSEAERNFRWNAIWLTADAVAFSVGGAFVNQTTVLPTFVGKLTDSTLLVGLIATIQSGAWLLPQLVAARLVAGKPRKRPYMLGAAIVGRPVYLILGAVALAAGPGNSTLLLATLYAALTVFLISDGFVAVAWFDILSRAIPATRRGRLIGMNQIAGGLASTAVGGVVALVLGSLALPFPANYGVLFALAGLAYVADLGALSMLREPADASPDARPAPTAFRTMLRPALREDRRFQRLVVVRIAFGVGVLIFPFYVIYADRALALGAQYVGFFLSAQVAGGILGGLLLGQLADRHGTHVSIRAAIACATLSPGLALVAHFAGPALGAARLALMATVFVAVGVAFSSYLVAFINYALEIAPPGQQATYAGLYNTLSGGLLVVPALAGWFLQATSYPALFAVALGLLAAALVASLGLPSPRPDAHQAV